MATVGKIIIARPPLKEGEAPYILRRIYVEFDKKRKLDVYTTAQMQVEADGSVFWEIPDNEHNREYAKGFSPPLYTVVFPPDMSQAVEGPKPPPELAVVKLEDLDQADVMVEQFDKAPEAPAFEDELLESLSSPKRKGKGKA